MLDTNSRGCSIINVASASGIKAAECFGLYDASRHAVTGLTKSCALDYVKYDITVNAVCPGVIDTGIFANAPDFVREVNKKSVPVGRLGKPEEIGYLSLFLASDMARFITGAPLYDGEAEGSIPAVVIPKAIVENQSVNVDSVSGATITSYAIRAAVEDCLNQAGLDVSNYKTAPEKKAPRTLPGKPTSS